MSKQIPHSCLDCNKTIFTATALRCLSCANKINSKKSSRFLGKKCSNQHKQKLSLAHSKELNSFYGKKHSSENIAKMLETRKQTWLNSNGTPKQNKVEKHLEHLLNNLFPGEYKYVGNWKFFIDRFNPDFVNCNGQKKIIELFGDYWHNRIDYKQRDKKRLEAYSNFGYKTLIVWQHELEDEQLINKLISFNKV